MGGGARRPNFVLPSRRRSVKVGRVSRTRTHYEVLGVAQDATPEQVRRAYRALVRRYHPDHLGERQVIPQAKLEAERRIRELNEAWQALRDPDRRARYDLSVPRPDRAVPYSPFPPGTEPEPPGGFDEWFADANRRRDGARVVTRSVEVARPFRVRLLVGVGVTMLAGILLIVALTGTNPDPVPPVAVRGMCVQVLAGPQAVEVPCDGPNDGRVLGQVMVPGECPNGAVARRLTAGDPKLTCLGKVTAPAS